MVPLPKFHLIPGVPCLYKVHLQCKPILRDYNINKSVKLWILKGSARILVADTTQEVLIELPLYKFWLLVDIPRFPSPIHCQLCYDIFKVVGGYMHTYYSLNPLSLKHDKWHVGKILPTELQTKQQTERLILIWDLSIIFHNQIFPWLCQSPIRWHFW